MGSRMKTTLNIDDTVMAELKREAARQGRTMSERDRIAPTAHLSTKAGENPRPSKVPQRRSTGRCCRPRCSVPRHGGSLVLAEADPVAACVREIMAERNAWTGSGAELLRTADFAGNEVWKRSAGWPKTP